MPVGLPPGPRGLPLIGSAVPFLRDMPGFMLELGARWPISAFYIGPYLSVLVNEPDEIQRILVSEAANFHKSRGLQRTRKVLGDGLLTSEGSFHLRQRRLAQKAFTKSRIQAYAPTMLSCGQELVRQWRDGERRNVLADLNFLTLRIAALTLFSADITGRAAEVGHALDTFVNLFPRLLIPGSELLERIPFQPTIRAVGEARRKLDSVIFEMIEERHRTGQTGTDLLGLLMAAVDDEGDGGRMTDQQLRDELVTMLLAGHETTALALTWCLYLLSMHPEWAERLRAEARSLEDLTEVERLPLARNVFAESLRLYPPAYATGRKNLQEYRLGPWTFPPGTTFFVSPLVTQRDARFFPSPLRFDPDRERPKHAYFPFGGGTRLCIGERFAWMEGVLLLATLVRDWSFAYPANRPPRLHGSLTLRPKDGLELILSKA